MKKFIRNCWVSSYSLLLLGCNLSLVTCSDKQPVPSYHVDLSHDQNCDFLHSSEICHLNQEYDSTIKIDSGYELASLSIIVKLPDGTSKELLQGDDYQISQTTNAFYSSTWFLQIFAKSVVGDITIEAITKKTSIFVKVTNDNKYCQLFDPSDSKQEAEPIYEIKQGQDYELGVKCPKNTTISFNIKVNNIELKDKEDYSYNVVSTSIKDIYYLTIKAQSIIDDIQITILCDDQIAVELNHDENCWFVDDKDNPLTNLSCTCLDDLTLSIKYNDKYEFKDCYIMIGQERFEDVDQYFSANNSVLKLPTSFLTNARNKNIVIFLFSAASEFDVSDYYYAIDNNDSDTYYCFDTNTIENSDENVDIIADVYKNSQKQLDKKTWNRHIFNENVHIGKNITYIGNYFLANCPALESNVIFDNEKGINNIKTFGENFMYKCEKFTTFNPDINKLEINNGIEFGANFLAYTSFNTPITFNTPYSDTGDASGSIIYHSFLSNCKQFSSDIVFKAHSISAIYTELFMHNCDNMQATIYLTLNAWGKVDISKKETAFTTLNKNAPVYVNGLNVDYVLESTKNIDYLNKSFHEFGNLNGENGIRYYRRIISKHRYITISKELSPNNKNNPSPSYYVGEAEIWTYFSYVPFYFADNYAPTGNERYKYLTNFYNHYTMDYSDYLSLDKKILIEKNSALNFKSPESIWPIYIYESFYLTDIDKIYYKDPNESEDGSGVIPKDKLGDYKFENAWWFDKIKVTWSKFGNEPVEINTDNFVFKKFTKNPIMSNNGGFASLPTFNWELVLPNEIDIFEGDIFIERII